jgi:hypothetical protein
MSPDILGVFIPIIAIVMGIGAGMLKLYLNYQRRKEMFALYHQERMAAIEKGIELPPLPDDFFHEDSNLPRRSPHGTLLVGLITVFIGLACYLVVLFAGLHADDRDDTAMAAPILIGIGAAFLIYYFTVGRKLAAAIEEERKARLAEAARVKNPTK